MICSGCRKPSISGKVYCNECNTKVNNLLKADEDGKLLIIPFKDGQIVWISGKNGAISGIITDRKFTDSKRFEFIAHFSEAAATIEFEADNIGKIVFTTKEEAEQLMIQNNINKGEISNGRETV